MNWATTLCAFLLISVPAGAAVQSVLGEKFSVKVPKGWKQLVPNKFNYILQGPANPKGIRSVVVVSHTGQKKIKIDPEEIRASSGQYFNQKKYSLARKGWTVKKEIAFKVSRNPAGQELHSIGVDYTADGQLFHDRTVYAVCGGSMFYLKSLDVGDLNHKHSGWQALQTFRCAK